MLWDTGVRVSELCDMNISQIDTAIHKTVITTKKTLQKRIIIWSDETHRVLLRYIPIRAELYKHNKADALFVGQSKNKGWNSRLTTRSVERIVKYYTKRADIVEKITPHSFRHGWANKRRDQNAPLSFIQRGLGHLNPASTFVYEQYTDKDFEKNAKAYLEYAV